MSEVQFKKHRVFREIVMEPKHIPFFSEEECKESIEYIHEKEKYLKNLHIKDEETYGKGRITTNLHGYYNFFLDNPKYIEKLSKTINQIFNLEDDYPIFVQSWANIYRKNEKIGWHNHSIISSNNENYVGYTANIFLGGDENIGMTYAVHDNSIPRYHFKNIKNKLGHMILMPNHIWHMSKNTSSKPRYTIGMTITTYHPEVLRKCSIYKENNVLLIHKNSNSKQIKYN